ncbi:Protein hgh1 [Microbotryomycetes sp. JL221]|nr:Protein hgh1 [Microbotryomycetes sp. JL221]
MSQQQQQTAQLLEVFGFLSDPQAPVRRIALASLLPYTTPDKPERSLFMREHYIEQIATMCADQEIIAHDALSALINLTSSIIVSTRIAKIPGYLAGLVRMIIDENAVLSDLACMLLSNLSKVEQISLQLLGLHVPFVLPSQVKDDNKDDAAATSGERAKKMRTVEDEIPALDLLLEVFSRGEGKKWNPNATYDFLAPVFANVAMLPEGRAFLLATPSPEVEPPLSVLISFTEHPSPIRRGGVASCLKNSAFQKACHPRLIAPSNEAKPAEGCIDILTQLLLPLCGPEEFDLDDLDQLPTDLQLLPKDKAREPDANIRMILIEALVLLASTRTTREAMRNRGVYPVIKVAHLAETSPKVKDPIVKLVNLLMRDEGESTAIEEIEADTVRPDADTVFISAEGTEVRQSYTDPNPAPPQFEPLEATQRESKALAPPQDEEDEEEMLLEV